MSSNCFDIKSKPIIGESRKGLSMNEPLLDQKIKQDATRIKNTVVNKIEDGIDTVSKDLNQSTTNGKGWINSGMAQVSNEFEKAKGNHFKKVADATTKFLKNVGNGLSRFFGKAADVTKKLPGDVGGKVSEYPWVAIPVILMTGFLLRGFLLPGRNHRR